MIRLIISIALLLATLAMYSQKDKKQSNYAIAVSVAAIQNPKGKVYFAIYTNKNFLKNPLKSKTVSVKNGTAQVQFTNITTGTYAIAVYHDKNENGKLDFDLTTGRPTEDYGFSNNPTLYGSPEFKNAKFEVVNKDVTFEVLLNDGF